MILYHVTKCSVVDKILKEGIKAKEIIDFGIKNKANIWFTNLQGIKVVTEYWVGSKACVIVCDIPKSYIRVAGYAYYGPPNEYAMEYYIRAEFKLKWIKDIW